MLPLVCQALPEVIREELEGSALHVVLLDRFVTLEVERALLGVVNVKFHFIDSVLHGFNVIMNWFDPSRSRSALLQVYLL